MNEIESRQTSVGNESEKGRNVSEIHWNLNETCLENGWKTIGSPLPILQRERAAREAGGERVTLACFVPCWALLDSLWCFLGLPQIHLLVEGRSVSRMIGKISAQSRDVSEINRKLIETCLENAWSMIRT